MADSLKILIVSSEIAPYSKTGGLADVAGALPSALLPLGCEVRAITPLYRCVENSGYKLTLTTSQVTHQLLPKLAPFDLYECSQNGVITYFTDNKAFFDRENLYSHGDAEYPDNAERFGFFCAAVLAALKAVDYKPDILHLNDWHTGLIPYYLRKKMSRDYFYANIKTLYTIHNLAYQGVFPKEVAGKIDIAPGFFNKPDVEIYGKINFMKAGIVYADALSTVSKAYAREILTKEYGCGLDGLLKARQNKVIGITNGVDYTEWNPETDNYIAEKYDYIYSGKKTICKEDLIKTAGLNIDKEKPLIGVVSRLAWQKGIDLIANIAGEIVNMGAGLVILGKGEDKYHAMLENIAKKYPGKMSVMLKFDDKLSHKIEAGSDIFLMPSRYEPCGLNQMYSLKYGTIPVVRATGGLDDIILDLGNDISNGNGFKFKQPKEDALLDAVKKALDLFKDKETWTGIVKRVMKEDYSWGKSAEEYVSFYYKIKGAE